jgi:oxygen-independent coproporphyrinogen III oxidase
MDIKQLVEKYNVPVPRYNCYPAPPYWESKSIDTKKWLKAVLKAFEKSNANSGMSLYVHMPFCDSSCTFCGFEKRVTQNHFVEEIYIDALNRQWQMYLENFGEKPLAQRIHMGGGTPTFFSPANLDHLFSLLMPSLILSDEVEMCFEGHPNSTSIEHLKVLHNHGFRSVSYGVQDFNENILKAINRIQPFENVRNAVDNARQAGFNNIKFDLIYGLPFQTSTSIKETIRKVGDFMPDSIAFYSFIHVPWERPVQKGLKENTLPQGVKKRNLFEIGKEELLKLGYHQVGIDHFALKSDPLYDAYVEKRISRGFAGYTTSKTDLMVGLGAMAISDAGTAYAQNVISVEDFHDQVFANVLPLSKIHYLSTEDLLLKEFIHDIMCKEEASWSQELFDTLNPDAKYEVIQIQKDGLIDVSTKGFVVTEKGKPFIRNICMIFDSRHHKHTLSKSQAMFSKSI